MITPSGKIRRVVVPEEMAARLEAALGAAVGAVLAEASDHGEECADALRAYMPREVARKARGDVAAALRVCFVAGMRRGWEEP